jgi:DNA-binding NarL/FixJ family response regulator
MSALVLISDLVMQSHVRGAAARAGTQLEIAGTTDALLEKAGSIRPALVILDLSHPGWDPRELVPRLKAVLPAGAAIVAFGPHVHRQRLEAATEAGCDRVISRGQFHAQVVEILKRRGPAQPAGES